MIAEHSTSVARQRVLDTAEGLFYRVGVRATGINQIIEESGVAKATFYAHFKSKDALCLAYLERMSERELEAVHAEVARRRTPLGKFMAMIESLEPWLLKTDFRGCAFLNMVPEAPDFHNPMRRVGADFYKKSQAIVQRLVEDLIESDLKQFGHLKAKDIARDYMTIFSGAIALAEIHHEIEPVRNAIRLAKQLVVSQ